MIRKYIRFEGLKQLIASVLMLGLVLGFIFGTVKGLLYVYSNRYFELGMYNIAFSYFCSIVNYFSLISPTVFLVVSLVLFLIHFILTHFLRDAVPGIYRPITATISKIPHLKLFSLALITAFLLLALNSLFYYHQLQQDRKGLNVLFITIDALRADHLGTYGYVRDTSPFIDRFAAESVLFRYAFSQESYTQASVPSYFTSTYPSTHNVLYDQPMIDVLNPSFVTIAEILKEHNYTTAAFVFNPHLKEKYNFGQGFDLYDDNKEGFDESLAFYETYETASKIFEKTERYLQDHKNRPVFLYIHYRDVHNPYAPPPPYDKVFLPPNTRPPIDLIQHEEEHERMLLTKENAELFISLYDGEIRYTDYYLEKTIEMFEKYDISTENSIIIITADHGEEFFDYHPNDPGGRYHGRTLYMEQIHVPLIISMPQNSLKRKVIDSYVELIDIAPTILDALGIEWKKYNQFQGQSLMPILKDGTKNRRIIYSGGNYNRAVIIDGDWKYYTYDKNTKENREQCFIRPSGGYKNIWREELYNIKIDPDESVNVINEQEVIALKVKEKLLDIKRNFSEQRDVSSVELDDQTKEELKSLGYIE